MGHKYWIYADKKQEARCQKDDDMEQAAAAPSDETVE